MKRFWLFLAALLPFFAVWAQAETPASWCIAVWYPSSEHPGGYDSLMNHVDLINVVHPFWYSPRPDGTLLAHGGAEDAQQLAAWRAAGLRIMPSVFAGLSGVIETPERRRGHIAEIIALVERMDYDGIDIDYEGFGLHTREAFSLFIEDLAAALHAQGRLISIAVHPKTSAEGTSEATAAQDWTRIAPAVDVMNIMTYDYTGRIQPPGPIAPADWVMDVLAYAEMVTDLGKVRMGVPFYGYTWVRGSPPATATTWESVQRLITAFQPVVMRDPVGMEASVEVRGRGLPRQYIAFADAAALRYKLEQAFIRFPALGGVAVWGLGGEDPANWDVLSELRPAACVP